MSGESNGPAESNWTALRQNYDVYSWEYRTHPTPLLETCDWESDEVVSVFISRDPLDRMLAGDGYDNGRYNITSKRTPAQWWAWANDDTSTKNFAYEVLSGDRSGLAPGSMERAKKLLDRIDFVIDQDCLNENLVKLAKLLGLNNTEEQLAARHKGGTVHHLPARERIGNDTLWEYLLERNKAGIELHEHAKERSFVVCNDSIVASSNTAKNSGDENKMTTPVTTASPTTVTTPAATPSSAVVAAKKGKSLKDASIDDIHVPSFLIGMLFTLMVVAMLFLSRNRKCFQKRVVSTGQESSGGATSNNDARDEEVKALL